jgi:CHAT domain-containing protein
MSRRYYKLMMIGLLTLLICLGWGQMATAKPNPRQLVQQGVEQYQQGDVTTAIAFWQRALKTYHNNQQLDEQTIVLENLGRAYQQLGKNDQATNYWQQTINNYRSLGNQRQLERSLTEQAQIYARLGQHQQAISILCGSNTQECLPDSAIALAQQHQDRLGEVAAWGSLGEAYRLRGDYQLALPYLQTSLKMARQIKHSSLAIAALNSLGNTYSSLAQINYRRATSAEKRGENFGSNNLVKQIKADGLNSDRQGLKYFTESLQQARQQQDRSAQLKAIINAIPLDYRLGEHDSAKANIAAALSLLPTLPISQDKVYTQIKLAKLLQPELVTPNSCYNSDIQPQAIQLLQQAIKEAENVGDRRSQSFAWGELGHIYECRQDYQQAFKLTKKARWLAEQDIEAKDSLYLWEWQTGRIFKQQQNKLAAIRAYQQAISTLDSIRQNILTSNRDIQFDFRDLVEPVYRQLIALQLDKIPTASEVAATDDNFNSVLTVLDSFQLAELQNYFGNDCAINEVSNQEDIQANNSVAIFHSIVLPQGTAIIATFADGDRQIVWLNQERETLRKTIISFNEGLVRWYDNDYDQTLATTLYDQMIRPFVTTLKQKQIQTLVFIQDGILRNVPMSALYDGKQYLIEQYAVATTPSLTVTKSKPIERENLKVLALGLSAASSVNGSNYPSLPNVQQEIYKVTQKFQDSKPLLNQKFTSDRLKQELATNNYSIVHIASHAQFGIEPQDTFLVTGNNQTLTISELDRIIRQVSQRQESLELLSLTACDTALGDERASLGLAGVAVQAGANSAMASLWSIDDGVTPQLVEQFYTSLQNPDLNKAQALQTAQLKLIEQDLHPAYWAPFILIGNWL